MFRRIRQNTKLLRKGNNNHPINAYEMSFNYIRIRKECFKMNKHGLFTFYRFERIYT